MQSTDQMLPLAADLLADLRMVTRASPRLTLRASSLLCLSRLWPARAVEAHAVAAAMAAMPENRNHTATDYAEGGEESATNSKCAAMWMFLFSVENCETQEEIKHPIGRRTGSTKCIEVGDWLRWFPGTM